MNMQIVETEEKKSFTFMYNQKAEKIRLEAVEHGEKLQKAREKLKEVPKGTHPYVLAVAVQKHKINSNACANEVRATFKIV